MKVAIIDYEGGNLASVACALRHLGVNSVITSDANEILTADKVIFPGVGAAGATMAALKKTGLVDVIKTGLREKGIPCLGICIGIQVLFEHSEEDDCETLAILPGRVKRFPEDSGAKIPHIGWNKVSFVNPGQGLLKGVAESGYFYFVNSYYVEADLTEMVLGWTEYAGKRFASLVQHDNWTASQFHLEKSGLLGLNILHNFLVG